MLRGWLEEGRAALSTTNVVVRMPYEWYCLWVAVFALLLSEKVTIKTEEL